MGEPNKFYSEIPVLMKKSLEQSHPTGHTVKYVLKKSVEHGAPNDIYCEISVLIMLILSFIKLVEIGYYSLTLVHGKSLHMHLPFHLDLWPATWPN